MLNTFKNFLRFFSEVYLTLPLFQHLGCDNMSLKVDLQFSDGVAPPLPTIGHSNPMKPSGVKMRIRFVKIALFSMLSIGVIRLSFAQSPEEARKLLEQKDIPYTLEAFRTQVFTGNTEAVRLFLAAGMDVNAKYDNGWTVLMKASYLGDTATVQALLEKGADVNAKMSNGMTALMYASAQGHLDIVQALLAKGADVNAKDNKGTTALMYASAQGHMDIVQALLKKGAHQ